MVLACIFAEAFALQHNATVGWRGWWIFSLSSAVCKCSYAFTSQVIYLFLPLCYLSATLSANIWCEMSHTQTRRERTLSLLMSFLRVFRQDGNWKPGFSVCDFLPDFIKVKVGKTWGLQAKSDHSSRTWITTFSCEIKQNANIQPLLVITISFDNND